MTGSQYRPKVQHVQCNESRVKFAIDEYVYGTQRDITTAGSTNIMSVDRRRADLWYTAGLGCRRLEIQSCVLCGRAFSLY